MQTNSTDIEEETYDTSDKESVNKARKTSARTRAVRLEFIEAAMTTEQGRAWFYDILIRCKVFGSLFVDDPNRTFFNLGMQNIGLQILDDIQTAAPDKYITMINENKTKKYG